MHLNQPTEHLTPAAEAENWGPMPSLNDQAGLMLDWLLTKQACLDVDRLWLAQWLAAIQAEARASAEAEIDVERLGEAVFRVGIGYRQRETALIATRIGNGQDGAKAAGEFAEAVAAEYAAIHPRRSGLAATPAEPHAAEWGEDVD
jgi:hypothetical protein